ncbi:lysozyme [Pseudomonas plecoglossicida]|uniref:lysozyme n=1 Tax=Pseudomonas putida group TaxID=136845 RepID=UPI002410662C|nr:MULTISPECIES: lysozyme [Pseudomonas putida group]MDQ7967109.1 lysozyme [Pseudomonas plecoglossicida]WFG05299.1 lysozyme [Pseudomonas putida]
MLNKRIAGYSLAATISIATAVVASFEGLRTKTYLDPIGIPTICYGHTATAKIGQSKSPEECKAQLSKDLLIAIEDVESRVKVPLTVERRAALVSFVYNVGGTKFGSSTLLKKLNAGDPVGACAELSKWVYAGGVRLNGLVTRRAEERALCEVGL